MTASAAERMDRMYRFQRYIYDVTRRPYLLGRTRLIDGLCPPAGGAVLEVGCGTAWNLIKVARAYPETRLFGFDVSRAMLDTARRHVAAAGLNGRIHLKQGDATTFSAEQMFGASAFDRVFLSYTLSMIPGWTEVLAHALAHVAPHGQLHVVDFGDGRRLPAVARAALHGWLKQFDVTPRADLSGELLRLSDRSGCQLIGADMYRGYAQYAIISRP